MFLGRAGLQILDKGGEVAFIDSTNSDLCLLPNPARPHLLTICKEKIDIYWLGTGHGLYRYNHNTSEVILYTDDTANPDYIPTKGVISSFKDHRGNLWFGGTNGLLKYSSNNQKIEFIDSLLYETNITAIAGVDSSLLVIGVGRNMVVFDLANYYATSKVDLVFYDYHSGFLGESIIQNAIFTDSKGYVWTSSTDYVTRIDPKELLEDTLFLAEAHLTEVSIPSAEDEYKWEKIVESFEGFKKPLFLSRYQNDVKIGFNAATFKHRKRLKFKHRLVGSKDYGNWVTSSFDSNSSVTYTNLPTGNYTFEVVAYNLQGVVQKQVTQFHIKVFSWIDYLVPLLISSLIIVAILSFLLIQTKFKKKENEIKLLTKEFEKKNLRLEIINAQYTSHSLFNSLTAIENRIMDEDTDNALDCIQDLASINRYFLETSKIDNVSLKEEKEFIESYLNIEKLRHGDFNTEIIFEEELPPQTPIPRALLFPFIENAVVHGIKSKSTNNRALSIKGYREDNKLVFVIQDNGIGRKASAINRQKMDKWADAKGMSLVQEKINILKSLNKFKIQIETEDLEDENNRATGTKVTIYITSLT